jgi:vitamin B12 transporter
MPLWRRHGKAFPEESISQETCQTSPKHPQPSREGSGRRFRRPQLSAAKVGVFPFSQNPYKEICMNRILPIVAAFLHALPLFSQEGSDTAAVYHIPEVVVTATRTPISPKDSPSPVDVIDATDIRRQNASTVADVLRTSNGVFVNDQGSEGALKTVSLRGSSSSQVLVLVDGNRVNSFQNGLVDLGLLPIGNIERIEVVRGGSSALYGTDALGGVINILTRRGGADLRLRAQASMGSFGYQRRSLQGEGDIASMRLAGGVSDERGRDDYPFVVARSGVGDTTVRRTDADFRRSHAYVSGIATPDDRSSVQFSFQHVMADRGTPGPVFGFGSLSTARQADRDLNFTADYTDLHLDKAEFVVRSGFHYSLQRYVDPNPVFPFDSYYRNRYVNVDPQLRIHISPAQRIVLGAEFAQGVLEDFSTPALRAFDRRVHRVQKSAYVSNEVQLDFDRELFNRFSLFQTVRYDDISSVAHAVTPKLGANLRVTREGNVHLRMSVGQSFRAPTFNDLYYRGLSNPMLKPERSTGVDAGLLSEFEQYGKQSLELTYFHVDTENRILFDLVTFMPVNIGRALTRGIETKYEGAFFSDILEIGANYTYTDARKRDQTSSADPTFNKQLKFVPQHTAHLSISVELNVVTVSIVHSIIGRRFTNDDNTASTDPYRLTNANFGVRFPLGPLTSVARFEVNNIFDRDYEVFPMYPIPKRSYRAAIGIEY